MNVLSLFDGISCGQVALNRAGIEIDNYYASEIDKWALQITQKNYPHTIQLGDIQKWRDWDLPQIDLIIGGSPCQGFSFAGKGLNFEDPRSKLLFDYVDILNHYQPKYFLLENVKMNQKSQNVISEYLKVEPMFIYSSLVSAQSRKRLYWFNWEADEPQDKNIKLKDIIDFSNVEYLDKEKYVLLETDKLKTQQSGLIFCGYLKGNLRKNGALPDTEHLSRVHKQPNRIYHIDGVKPTLSSSEGSGRYYIYDGIGVRKLTYNECERLQTLPDNYTEGISNSQRYKSLGNGWTIDVISHLFKNMK